ncbi:MAG: sodium:solute symporter family protein, partial [Acidobacteriota bacterium]|nr:sodium:solute symporter family protein [Acidobacteriota bacterium]
AAVLVLVVGALLATSIYRSTRLKTHDDFMVADRGLPAVVLVFTLLCSWIGAGSLFAGAEFAVDQGLAALWLPAGGWAGLILIYFIAGKARTFAQYTVSDLLEARYNPVARVIGTICIIISYTAIVSYQFQGGGRVLNLAFGVSQTSGTVILAVFVILFTALAGMSSIAWTDLVIGIIVTVGCLLALPVLVGHLGGWGALRTALPANHFSLRGTLSWPEILGYFFPTLMLMIGNQSTYQKFFSARSERDARLSVVGWVCGTVVLETIIVLLAMAGGVLFLPVIHSGKLPAWGIIPYTARHGLIPWAGAIFLGAIFAKVISTGNNFLFSPATSVVHDLFQRFLMKKSSDRALLLLSRTIVVVLGLIALAQAFQPSILKEAVYAYDVYGAGITPAVIAAFFWKRATAAGGLSSIIAGTFVALLWKMEGYHFPMIFPALAASLAALFLVSYLTPPPADAKWQPFFRTAEREIS